MPKASKSDREDGKPSDRLEDLMKVMQEENLHELEINDGDVEVKLVRHGRVPVAVSGRAHGPAHHAPAVAPAAGKAEEDLGNLKPVKAPLAGVFYRAPSPQAALFVKEGDPVSPEKTLCIIEAMKVLNEINGGISGTVARILVENGKAVSSGQALFLIDPAG